MDPEVLESRFSRRPHSPLFARVAETLLTKGEVSRAIEICKRGLNRYPDYVSAKIILARCYLKEQELDEAAELARSVLHLYPHVESLNDLLTEWSTVLGGSSHEESKEPSQYVFSERRVEEDSVLIAEEDAGFSNARTEGSSIQTEAVREEGFKVADDAASSGMEEGSVGSAPYEDLPSILDQLDPLIREEKGTAGGYAQPLSEGNLTEEEIPSDLTGFVPAIAGEGMSEELTDVWFSPFRTPSAESDEAKTLPALEIMDTGRSEAGIEETENLLDQSDAQPVLSLADAGIEGPELIGEGVSHDEKSVVLDDEESEQGRTFSDVTEHPPTHALTEQSADVPEPGGEGISAVEEQPDTSVSTERVLPSGTSGSAGEPVTEEAFDLSGAESEPSLPQDPLLGPKDREQLVDESGSGEIAHIQMLGAEGGEEYGIEETSHSTTSEIAPPTEVASESQPALEGGDRTLSATPAEQEGSSRERGVVDDASTAVEVSGAMLQDTAEPAEKTGRSGSALGGRIERSSDEGRIISRTMAEIYEQQGELNEALITYRLLRQRRPELLTSLDTKITELELKIANRTSPPQDIE